MPIPDITSTRPQRIAVVGGGVAGLTAAWLLQRRHHVTLYERETRAGGHSNTVVIERGPDAGLAVDTGFIVYNERNYPTFQRLLAHLGVATQPSDMSFSFHDQGTGFYYAGGSGLPGLLAQRRNLIDGSFLGMLSDIVRFNRRARRDLSRDEVNGVTLGAYVDTLRLGRAFAERYLYPMGAAIWSAPVGEMRAVPAASFLRFFDRHGLLGVTGQPRWRTITGGSHTYVRAMLDTFQGLVRLGRPIGAIRRSPEAVTVTEEGGAHASYDHVVIATHADETLALLADPTPDERRLLSTWRYSRNRTILHTDPAVLPPRRSAWASWNYARGGGSVEQAPVSVSYYMNRLQRLASDRTYCVTLNRRAPVRDEHVVREMIYTHPVFSFESRRSQTGLPSLNRGRTSFCGSYFGDGFHEDAVASSAAVAARFRITL